MDVVGKGKLYLGAGRVGENRWMRATAAFPHHLDRDVNPLAN